MPQVTAYKADTLVGVKPDSIVALKVPNENKFELYVTSRTGVPFPLSTVPTTGVVNNIINTDGELVISGTSTVTINISSTLLATINSALQAGDNISELVNDEGYITILDVPVSSVFGRTGNITPQTGDYTTTQVTETTDKNYQTDDQKLFNDVTSSAQTQINSKTPLSRTLNINDNTFDLTSNREWRVAQADTGVLTWDAPGISIASPTQINCTGITGVIVDNETNPASPTFVKINYIGQSNITVTTIGGGQSTYILLQTDGLGGGTLHFQNTFPTSAERKVRVYLGEIEHPTGTIIISKNEPDFITSPLAQYKDLSQSLGTYINNGILAYANGSNLQINTTGGNIYRHGINFVGNTTNRENPNILEVLPITPLSYLPRTQTGLGGGLISTVDVDKYDVGGVVTTIPGSNNRASIRYIYSIPNIEYIIQYGQQWYNNLNQAVTAVGRESQVILPTLIENTVLIGVLVATKGCISLNDPTTARFFPADKLGQIIGATSGISTGTRQLNYNNSIQPQTVVSDALGADTWKNGRGSDASIVMQWQNIAGTITASVSGSGDVKANSFIKSGGTPNQFLKADGSVDIRARITNATTTGGYAVDWNAGDVWQLTLTGATTISDTNLPTGAATKEIKLLIKGVFGLTLPAYWEATPSSGVYDGTKWNYIKISCINGTMSSEKVIYSNEVLVT